MSRMSDLTAERRKDRHDRASAAVADILQNAARSGIEMTLIGSLAKGGFGAHSDVDLLVRGPLDLKRRIAVEQLVANGMRSSEIPYDLIFEDDLSEDRLQELLHDIA